MSTTQPPDRLAEEERRAYAVYDQVIRPLLRAEDDGKYVAVAWETGDYEIDADDYAATNRLLARLPGARLWLMRAGQAAAYRMRHVGPGAA
ncbi:MAG: hypothetical protein K2R98_33745 [Gemmataceae bacterium]|nr:hypothetical protein [Gemmataceae bacterium]